MRVTMGCEIFSMWQNLGKCWEVKASMAELLSSPDCRVSVAQWLGSGSVGEPMCQSVKRFSVPVDEILSHTQNAISRSGHCGTERG